MCRFVEEPCTNLKSGPVDTDSRIQSQIAVVDLKSPKGPVEESFLQPTKRPEVVHHSKVTCPIRRQKPSNAVLADDVRILLARNRAGDENIARRHDAEFVDALAEHDDRSVDIAKPEHSTQGYNLQVGIAVRFRTYDPQVRMLAFCERGDRPIREPRGASGCDERLQIRRGKGGGHPIQRNDILSPLQDLPQSGFPWISRPRTVATAPFAAS